MDFKPQEFEKKWKKYWDENGTYRVSNDSDRPKYYVLDMFPYPSGSGLHVGHPLGYIASDIFSRYKRLKGFNVLHPMGYDAYGLPAEQHAIQTGVHPAVSTGENIDRYRQQLDNIGFSFDWNREVRTCKPQYYKWTQWIFVNLFEHFYDNVAQKAKPIEQLVATFEKEGNTNVDAACEPVPVFSAEAWNEMSRTEQSDVLMNYRLAFRKKSYVNWCEEMGTVLAQDEIKDGVSERGGYPVERRAMNQWSLRITAYAERLLNGLQNVDFPESMVKMQTNWIGRSEGAQMFFPIVGSDKKLEIFTTRSDTIFGVTYMVLAPEHDWVDELTTPEQRATVDAYLEYVKTRSERDRMTDVKEVTGAFIGSYAINPFNKEEIPIWIGEYVLKDYGTGAIMAVPSDDDRDFDFATKFELPIIDIIDKSDYPGATRHDKLGKMINSGYITGMEVPDAIEATLQKIEKEGIGSRQINYKLRDATFGRQRYWGEPIPIVYDKEGIPSAMDVKDLPLELPDLENFKPGGGKSPLARLDEWVNLPNGGQRETDTMPGYAGSSWYFLRYMDPGNETAFAGEEAIKYWENVDLYIGGAEHAGGHLMYSRFWHKFLHDLAYVPTEEPYKKLVNQGMIQGVVELLHLDKDKKDGQYRFLCAELAKKEKEQGKEFARITIHVDFVQDYGLPTSYLNIESIKKFMEWRPEYQGAIFECSKGTYHNGTFTPKNGAVDSQLFTGSEVGKMSKRWYNVINPDDVVAQYGADCFRMYEMFLGPLDQGKPWDTKGIDGVSRFLKRFWSLYTKGFSDEKATDAEQKILHALIKKVSEDIERLSFNTAVSAFMVAVNDLMKTKCNKREILEPMVILIAPFAPFVSEELWHQFGHKGSVHQASFPQLDESYLKEDAITYPIAINGKTRLTFDFPVDMAREEIEQKALELPELKKWTEGKTIRKVIVVPKRMINIVAN